LRIDAGLEDHQIAWRVPNTVAMPSTETRIGRFAHGWSKSTSLAFVTIAYIIAIAVGFSTAMALHASYETVHMYPLLAAAIADFAATVVIFICSVVVNNRYARLFQVLANHCLLWGGFMRSKMPPASCTVLARH